MLDRHNNTDPVAMDDDPRAGCPAADALARGVCRAFTDFGYVSLTEFTLRNGRRADLIALDEAGDIVIVEIKTSLEDYRADRKWRDYLAYCDRFFFAVPADFPHAAMPRDCGLLVADAYGVAVLREAPARRLHPARRRTQVLRFAQIAARRLARLSDPHAGSPAIGGPRVW